MHGLLTLLLLGLAGHAVVADMDPAHVKEMEISMSALVADDSCNAASTDGDSPCALSEVQLRAQKESARRTPPVDQNVVLEQHAMDDNWTAVAYDASCYGNAGSSECHSGSSSGKCVCPNGCMGADGNCYPTKNRVVASNFVLKNVKWPDQKVYVQRVSVFGQLKTTSYSSKYNFGQDKFTLYELPGLFEGRRMFFLASHKWPGYVVSIRATIGPHLVVSTLMSPHPSSGTALSLWGTYAVSLAKSHEPWALKDAMMQVCSLRSQGYPDAVKIGTSVPIGGSSIWSYIKSGSWFLYGYWYPERVVIQKVEQHLRPDQEIPQPEADTPGKGGFWIPDPPLPRGVLPDC